jgi:hypothetical protein
MQREACLLSHVGREHGRHVRGWIGLPSVVLGMLPILDCGSDQGVACHALDK